VGDSDQTGKKTRVGSRGESKKKNGEIPRKAGKRSASHVPEAVMTPIETAVGGK